MAENRATEARDAAAHLTPEALEAASLEPEGFLGYRMVRAAQALEQRFKEVLATWRLSPRQFSVLAVLAERSDVTVAELARAVLTTPQSMAALVDGLHERLLVARSGPRLRGVAAPLTITAGGRAALAEASPAILDMEREVFTGLPAERLETLRLVLAHLEERLKL
jgi:DNA-binding MarR family transcriptional regulator